MLGRGGMGEVYLARDEHLDRAVALKRIRPDLLDQPAARERFRREARLAARLSHPHIVQVFGFVADGDSDFLVMEYVRGVPLSRLIQERQGLGVRSVTRWLEQVARGLAVAHGRGLIHRDLKAENVLLTPEGDVKILDFGLARATTDESGSLTRSGMMLGTLRVMSPEQAAGSSSVDERSDLYSLGVLGYELLTGRSPFQGSSPRETLTKILTETPTPPEPLADHVPAELLSLICGLLAKNAEDRPADAHQVCEELSSIHQQLESDRDPPDSWSGEATLSEGLSLSPTAWPAEPTGPADPAYPAEMKVGPSELPRKRTSPPALVLLALVLLALVVLALAGILGRLPDLRPAPQHTRVVVAEPRLTLDESRPADPLVAAAVKDSTLGTLARLADVSVVSPSQTLGIHTDPEALARAVSADEVAWSEIRFEGGRAWVSLRRIDGDGTVTWSDSFEAPSGQRDLLLLAESVEGRWRRAYGAEDGYPSDTGVSDDAYRQFLAVRSEIWAGGRGDPQEHLSTLRALLEQSPDFLAAHLLAADLETHIFTATRDPRALERARRDVERARELAPRDSRVLHQAFRLAVMAGDLEAAERWLESFAHAAPGDVEVSVARAMLAETRGRIQEAVDHLQQAVDRHPSWANLYRLARSEQKIGEIDAARQNLRQLLDAWPESPWGLELWANLELQYGDLERAERLLRRLLAEQPARHNWTNLGLTLYLRGDYQAAIEAYGQAATLDPDHPAVLINLADALWARGRRAEAEQTYARTLEILAGRPEDGTAGSLDLLMKAQCLVHLGESEQAVALTLQALQAQPEDSEVAYQAAVVYAVAGDSTSAKVSAGRAVELGLQPRWLTIPIFRDLARDPAFADLLPRE